MKATLASKAQSFFLIAALFGYHTAAHSKLIIDKGEGRSEVSITIINPSIIACGVFFTISDGRASIGGRELQQPGEKVQFQHAFTADGKYTIALLGTPVQDGEQRFQACAVRQQVVVSVAGGQVSIEEPAAPEAAAPNVVRVRPIQVEPAADTQKTSQRSPGERANVAVLTGKVDSGNSPAAVAAKTYDTGKIYYFKRGHGGLKGTCVSKKWGVDRSRNVSEGIPYWGMKVYSLAIQRRELGFLAFNNIESYNLFGTINSEPKTFERVRDQDWQHCDYLIATGEELNALPALNNELNKPKTEFKLLHELTLAEAEKEWLNARGFKSRADYSNAATIDWQIAGVTYASFSKLGVTNIDQLNVAFKRSDAINCPLGYPPTFEGIIAFLTDEAASGKEKTPMESYCALRADKAKQEINVKAAELRRQELASPLLNCTKVNCTNSDEVESAVRDSWIKLRGKNSPWANICFDAIKLVKDLRNTGQIFGPHLTTTAFRMCNQGLKELP